MDIKTNNIHYAPKEFLINTLKEEIHSNDQSVSKSQVIATELITKYWESSGKKLERASEI